jgi:hypothetical protein
MAGLGADLQEDTIYPIAFVDGAGNRLDSVNKYMMHYEKDQFPPTNATRSVSLHRGPNYVPNPLNRYDIARGRRSRTTPTGRWTSTSRPGRRARRRNPTGCRPPAQGEFNVVIRNYWPKEAALDGTYKNPPIRRVQ